MHVVVILFYLLFVVTDKRPQRSNESFTKQSIFVEYILLQKKRLSFAAVRSQMKANLPKLIRRNIKSNKFAFGTP